MRCWRPRVVQTVEERQGLSIGMPEEVRGGRLP